VSLKSVANIGSSLSLQRPQGIHEPVETRDSDPHPFLADQGFDEFADADADPDPGSEKFADPNPGLHFSKHLYLFTSKMQKRSLSRD